MVSLRILVSVLAIIAVVQAKPSPQSDDLGVTDALGQATGIGATLFSGALTTTRAIGESVRDMASSAWTSATQALLGVNSAVRETTVGALEGTRDGLNSAGGLVSGSIRSGGRFAANALKSSFDTAQDATNSAGQFVAVVGRSAIQAGISTAESAGDLSLSAVQGVGDFASSANEVAGRVVVGGIENFSNPGRF